LAPEKQHAWLEGYLNSAKLQGTITWQGKLHPRMIIRMPESMSHLLEALTETLEQHAIRHYVFAESKKERCSIVIQHQRDINELAKVFELSRPKSRALLALIKNWQDDPALKVSLYSHKLDEFSLTLYGLILSHVESAREIEYTRLEETMACSSNELRQGLYFLDQVGLIHYFKKENNKEFISRSLRHFTQLEQMLEAEERRIRQFMYNESNGLFFECQDCGRTVSYLEALDGGSFQCSRCESFELKPISLSIQSYGGQLSRLSRFQNVLRAGGKL
jgi:transcription initiation factor IIE alpha subunit